MDYTLAQLRFFSEAAMESKMSDLALQALNLRAAFHSDKQGFEKHIRSLNG